MGVEEIIGTVIIDGVTYLIKKGVDALGKKILKYFRDENNDGVPDSEEPEWWVYDKDETGNTVEYYENLQKACNDRWEYFSQAVYTEVPSFISNQFGQFFKNPLCVSITSSLLVVAAFFIVRELIRSTHRGGV